jgi:2-amino-4-hydroxy-6-hydroxymethyldihydropteridine diphosphokinase
VTRQIPSTTAVIGFGGNVGGDDAIIERFVKARAALEEYSPVISAPLYRTAPIGPPQAPFLNTAVALWRLDPDGKGTPDELMEIVLGIERSLGRDRRVEQRWGPRPIDLDILVWGARVVRTPTIELPHPRLKERRFALEPLRAALGLEPPIGTLPGIYLLPGTDIKLQTLHEQVQDQPLELVANEW